MGWDLPGWGHLAPNSSTEHLSLLVALLESTCHGLLHFYKAPVTACCMQVRMELLAQLWAVGISAALLPKESPSLTEQYEFAHASGARWLVILDRNTLSSSQCVRVKSLERKGEDVSIHIADLGRFLQLGLSGAQDPSKTIALLGAGSAAGGSGVSGFGVHAIGAGAGGVQSAGSGSSSSSTPFGGASMLLGLQRGLGLHRSGSDTRLGGVNDSIDAELAEASAGAGAGSGGLRESFREREREQGGKHRDRRR
jgi:hypothetical protein